MSSTAYTNSEAGFALTLPTTGFHEQVVTDTSNFLAIRLTPADNAFEVVVQRFKASVEVRDGDDFEAVLEGVLLGLDETFGGVRVLEREVDAQANHAITSDLVLRGMIRGVDTLQRRRLLTNGPVPPATLFMLTASCSADRFLVFRRVFEEIFESFMEIK